MREKRACGVKRGEEGWTKNLVDLGLKGGIKCGGCWIAPWTLLIRGEKTRKPYTQIKQVRKAGLAEKGKTGKKTLRLGDSKGRWPEETGTLCLARKALLE